MANAKANALVAFLPLICAVSQARADEPIHEVIVRADGVVERGDLVDKVVNDHVTIQLADGNLLTVDWRDIKELREPELAATAPPPAPPSFGQHHFGIIDTYDLLRGAEVGVAAAWSPTDWLELESSGTLGGHLGPSLSEWLRLGLPVGSSMRVGLGAGLQITFTPSADKSMGAPPHGYFLDSGVFFDWVFAPHLMLRVSPTTGYFLASSTFPCTVADVARCTGTPNAELARSRFFISTTARLSWFF